MKYASKYSWNKHNDQPRKIRDKNFKRKLYLLAAYPTLKILLTSLLLPFIAIILIFKKRCIMNQVVNNIGLCVNPDYPLDSKISPSISQLQDMVAELGVDNILIRIPLQDYDNIEKYFDFLNSFSEKKILINILQDREHIDDLDLTKQRLREIFNRTATLTKHYQIGNSVNRRKWGFISQDEYFQFFKVAQNLKENEFPDIELIGSNIIDFELPYFIRSLLHWWPIKYDGVAVQLYVDRRGSPENTQFGCNTISKINWFSSIINLSRKSKKKLFITETNWPIEDTIPFAPAKGNCMVSEELQTAYLVRYYLMVIATGQVSKCYWHQLVAPGYGLVDNRGTELRKRDAYYSFKTLIQLTKGQTTRSYSEKNNLYRLLFETTTGTVEAIWAHKKTVSIKVEPHIHVVDLLGRKIQHNDGMITVCKNVTYLIDETNNRTSA